MFIYYAIISLHGEFGEPWTKYSWVQLLGLFVLLYGTAVYNAPNSGSIKLLGQWFAFGIDLRDEYEEAEREQDEDESDGEEEERKIVARRRTSANYLSPRQHALRTKFSRRR